MGQKPDYKFEVDVMKDNILLPFTAKQEGKEWVIYSHNRIRLGTCNEAMAHEFNTCAAKWIADNDIKPWEG